MVKKRLYYYGNEPIDLMMQMANYLHQNWQKQIIVEAVEVLPCKEGATYKYSGRLTFKILES